jgi:hypothetical protein
MWATDASVLLLLASDMQALQVKHALCGHTMYRHGGADLA